MAYILLGQRISAGGAGASGIDRLAAAMLVASSAALPIGVRAALPAFSDPVLLLAAVGVGVSSSVIPQRMRPARDGAAAARNLRPAALAAAGHL